MENSKLPKIIYCCFGMEHLIYTIWSIRSLDKYNYRNIEVIVSNQNEKDFICNKIDWLTECYIFKGDTGDYPIIGYQQFALEKYINTDLYINKPQDEEIVICDSDVLWLKNPLDLFTRFNNQNWVQKITPVNPNSYLLKANEVDKREIGIHTILNYIHKTNAQIKIWPNFRVNGGLYKLRRDDYKNMLENFIAKIRSLNPKDMYLSEALMSLTYAELGLIPTTDKRDIIYKYRPHNNTAKIVTYYSEQKTESYLNEEDKKFTSKLLKFKYQDMQDIPSGYETAKHYLSDQKDLLHKVAIKMGLDNDNLIEIVKSEMKKKKFKKMLMLPKRIIKRLFR